jgi:predicted alpha/beta hydrolase
MLGASTHAAKVARAVFLAPHVAFWRDYYWPWRYLLLLVWHGAMPALTLAKGYFPGSTLGLGEDLPKQFALQWATLTRPGCRPGRRKSQWDEVLSSHRRLHAPTLAISVPHDAFAPPAAARRMEPLYPGLAIRFETATPEQLGCRRLGHMSFLRRTTGPYFWARAAAWILQQERDADMVPPVTP